MRYGFAVIFRRFWSVYLSCTLVAASFPFEGVPASPSQACGLVQCQAITAPARWFIHSIYSLPSTFYRYSAWLHRAPAPAVAQALVFGMGNVGRGYVAPLLMRNGYRVVFADQKLMRRRIMEDLQGYRVIPIGDQGAPQVVAPLSVIHPNDYAALAALAGSVDWIFTAVRAGNIPSLVKPIGHLIESRLKRGRYTALNIVFVENLPLDRAPLREFKTALLAYGRSWRYRWFVEERVGCVASVTEVTIPDQGATEGALDVRVEPEDYPLWLDSRAIRGAPLTGHGFEPSASLEALHERKLLIHNLGHATLAYLAAIKQLSSLAQAMTDPMVFTLVRQIMEDSAAALALKYPEFFEIPKLYAYIDNLFSRFFNSALGDTVERVGRFPLRKLLPEERFLGALSNAAIFGTPCEPLQVAIGAALWYADYRWGLVDEAARVRHQISDRYSVDIPATFTSLMERWRRLAPVGDSAPSLAGEHLSRKWEGHVQAFDGSVYRISAAPDVLRRVAPDPSMSAQFAKQKPFQVRTRGESIRLKKFFEDTLAQGGLDPVVIVNIKDLYPGIRDLYIQRLIQLSKFYNGNLTCVLVVEEDPARHPFDFPSVFTSLQKAIACLGHEFDARPIFFVADGGRNLRGFPLTLRYGGQGLIPYSRDRTYLQESIARLGTWALQMNDYGGQHLLLAPSDGIFNFEKVHLLNGQALSDWSSPAHLLIPLAQIPDNEDASQKVIAGVSASQRVDYVMVKPSAGALASRQDMNPTAELRTLPFFMVWHKALLLRGFLNELSHRMMKGIPLLEYPGDFYQTFIESLFDESIAKGNGRLITSIAYRYFGAHGSRIDWAVLGASDGFSDQGHLRLLRQSAERGLGRIRHIWKDPRVHLAGFDGVSGDYVVIRGAGRLAGGRNLKLKNVIIDTGNDPYEQMTIPDDWTLQDVYLGVHNVFHGTNGFLSGVMRVSRTYAPEPLDHMTFEGAHGTSTILTTERESVLVSIPFNADHTLLRGLRFGKQQWSATVLQSRTDIWAIRYVATRLEREIAQETMKRFSGLFPINKEAAHVIARLSYTAWVDEVSRKIQAERPTDGHFIVTVEGLQGAGKSYFAAALAAALNEAGRHAVIMEEDWFTHPRAWREQMRVMKPLLWRQHRSRWHRWDKYRQDLSYLFHASAPFEYKMKDLYSPFDGFADQRKRFKVYPDTVFIVTGFYIQDESKWEFPTDPRHRLSIYLGINLNESLAVKKQRDVWRSEREIQDLDEKIYRPALEEYTTIFDPASAVDIAVRIDPANRSVVEIVKPQRLPVPRSALRLERAAT